MMSNGTVSNRISTVVSAIVAHLHITEQEDGTTLQDVYRKKPKLKPCAAPTKAYQLRPVKDCTASRRYCMAATGGNDSAAAAATSPAYGAGGMGTEAAAETTSPESSSDTGTEEAASVSMSAATSMSGADAEEVVEKLRWAARWSAKGMGRLVRARDLDGRAREEGNGFAGGD